MSVKPPYLLCPICARSVRGWGYSNPNARLWTRWGQLSLRYFCSQHHQNIYTAIKKKYGEDTMIDPDGHEIAAMRAAIVPMSEFVESEIGWETRLQDYEREEILMLIEVIVTAYQDALIARAETKWPDIDIPYNPTSKTQK